MSQPSPIVVVSMNRDKYSETFIQDGFDALPQPKALLYGAYLPTHVTADWRIQGGALPAVHGHWAEGKLTVEVQAERNLEAWLMANRPRAVLAHYGPSGVALAPICARLGLPLVVHFHGYDAHRRDILEAQGKAYDLIWRHAQAIVAVSAPMQAQLLALGAPAARLHTLVYGVDTQLFTPTPLREGPFQVLFVGRLVPKKSPQDALRAFAALRHTAPDSRMLMVGDGPLGAECRELAGELGIADAVEWRGALPHAEVAAELARSHVLLQPSLTTADGDSEGTPLSVLEAGAAARAVVGTRHAGIPGVVVDGATGFLVAEGDWAGLAAALARLAQNRELAQALGAAGRARICQHFTQAHYHAALLQLLVAGK